MSFKEDILNQISQEIYEQSTIEIASIIFDYVNERRDELKYISHGLLRSKVGESFSDEQIVLAARVLSILRRPVLDECYTFFFKNNYHPISKEEVFSEPFINPQTGDVLKNYQDLINIFYVPNSVFLEHLKKSENG